MTSSYFGISSASFLTTFLSPRTAVLTYVFPFHHHALRYRVCCYWWFCRYALVGSKIWSPYLNDLFRLILVRGHTGVCCLILVRGHTGVCCLILVRGHTGVCCLILVCGHTGVCLLSDFYHYYYYRYECLLSQAFSPRYFSWTSGDPHRSGFKLHTAVLSILCVMFQV